MPCKNILKTYTENGIYHIYNRGVEKRDIFLDEHDYKTFLYFLKQYLLDPNDPQKKIREYKGRTLAEYSWSSYQEYLGIRGTKWVKPEFILNIFSDGTDNEMTGKGVYKEFVEELGYDSKEIIGGLTLE